MFFLTNIYRETADWRPVRYAYQCCGFCRQRVLSVFRIGNILALPFASPDTQPPRIAHTNNTLLPRSSSTSYFDSGFPITSFSQSIIPRVIVPLRPLRQNFTILSHFMSMIVRLNPVYGTPGFHDQLVLALDGTEGTGWVSIVSVSLFGTLQLASTPDNR